MVERQPVCYANWRLRTRHGSPSSVPFHWVMVVDIGVAVEETSGLVSNRKHVSLPCGACSIGDICRARPTSVWRIGGGSVEAVLKRAG